MILVGLLIIFSCLFFGKTGKILRYLILRTLLILVAYLSIPLAILILRF